ncbi:MAG: tol-pal system protein YbgF [Thermodesulfobacteriota bacterium]
MGKLSFVVGVGAAMVILVAGCATEGDFRGFQAEVRRELAHQDQQIRELRRRVEDLQAEKARGSKQIADQMAEMGALQREVAALRGQVESAMRGGGEDLRRSQAQLRQELDALRRAVEQLGGAVGVPARPVAPAQPIQQPPQPAERADDLYKIAMVRLEEGDNAKAREEFQALLSRFPESNLADNAQFWVGESYFREGNFKQAILEYEKVISQYPKSSKVPAALFKQGMAFEKLGDLESARYLYTKVTKDYPDSDQARMAEVRLRNIP